MRWFNSCWAFGILLLAEMTSAQASPTHFDLKKEAAQAKAQFEEFYQKYIIGDQRPGTEEMIEAARQLEVYWASQGIYCSVTATKKHPDWVRLKVLPTNETASYWRNFVPMGEVSESEAEQIRKQFPPPHPICDFAQEFFDHEAVGELYYYFDFVTDSELPNSHSQYTWEGDVYHLHHQFVLLPADFFEWIEREKGLDGHPGLQFALTQHKIHNLRVTRQKSPFHVRINERELARIPAFWDALEISKKKLLSDFENASLTSLEMNQTLRFFELSLLYSRAGHLEALEGILFLTELEDALKSGKTSPRYERVWPGMVLAKVQLGETKSEFFLVHLDSVEAPDKRETLIQFIQQTRGELERYAEQFESMVQDLTELEEKLLK